MTARVRTMPILVDAGVDAATGWSYEKWLLPDGTKRWKGRQTWNVSITWTPMGALGYAPISLKAAPSGITSFNALFCSVGNTTNNYCWGNVAANTVRIFSTTQSGTYATTVTVHAVGAW